MTDTIQLIKQWGAERCITVNGTHRGQWYKLASEYGEGLPPVGTDVEYGYKSEFPTDWYKGKILAYYDGFVWILEGHDNEPCTFPISGMELRPIKSERDRQIDAIEAMIYRSECETTSAAERLYNAGCRIGGGE